MHARLSDEEWFSQNGFYVGMGGAPYTGEELDDFRLVIVPLERSAGKPLNGPGLRKCLKAFKENGPAFRRLADQALARADRNPLGLLIRMVDDRDHRLEVDVQQDSPPVNRVCTHDTCAADGLDYCQYDVPAGPMTKVGGPLAAELAKALREVEAA